MEDLNATPPRLSIQLCDSASSSSWFFSALIRTDVRNAGAIRAAQLNPSARNCHGNDETVSTTAWQVARSSSSSTWEHATAAELLLQHPMAPAHTISTFPSGIGGRESARCNYCRADNFDVLITDGRDRRHRLPGEFRLVKCRECGLVYLNPRPTAEALDAYYPPDYAPYVLRGVFGALTRHLRRREALGLRRSLPAGAEVLEVGCAAGDLLVPLRDAGFRVTGVELSDHAATTARSQHQLAVHTGTLADASLAGDSFDAVIMRNVIEHVPDPRGDLGIAASLLRPGGMLSLRTDNVDSLDARLFRSLWYGFDFPRHLTLFSPATLIALVRSAGLEVTQVGYSLVPTHWIMSFRYWVSERPGFAAVSRLISPRNPLLLLMALAIAAAQKVVHDSGRFMVIARKPIAVSPSGKI